MIQRSDFPLVKVQGASGLALGPCVLFSVVSLLASCLVSGLAVVRVCGCGCGRVLLTFGGDGWLLAGWPVGCLVSGLAVAERVLCLLGSCGWVKRYAPRFAESHGVGSTYLATTSKYQI